MHMGSIAWTQLVVLTRTFLGERGVGVGHWALEASGDDPMAYLVRHIAGDWGDVDEHERFPASDLIVCNH
jgi:hypothetical protein